MVPRSLLGSIPCCRGTKAKMNKRAECNTGLSLFKKISVLAKRIPGDVTLHATEEIAQRKWA